MYLSRRMLYNVVNTQHKNNEMTGEKTNLKKFGERLRLAREARGLSQDDVVARWRKKDRVAISEYENGKRQLPAVDLPSLAAALDVSITYFFEDVLSEDDIEVAILEWAKRLPTSVKRQALALMKALAGGVDARDEKASAKVEELLTRLQPKKKQVAALLRSSGDLQEEDLQDILSVLEEVDREERGDGSTNK